jgi:hypothetical protein
VSGQSHCRHNQTEDESTYAPLHTRSWCFELEISPCPSHETISQSPRGPSSNVAPPGLPPSRDPSITHPHPLPPPDTRTVLLAIIYVLSRTENLQCPELDLAKVDLGEIRAQRLSQTPPHIIECAEAGEGTWGWSQGGEGGKFDSR